MSRSRVLLVEDRLSIGQAFAAILARSEVIGRGTVAEAERSLAASPCDAVVSHVRLPDGSSVVLFHRVRNARPEQAARFVFATASADDPRIRAAVEPTERPFVMKPFVVAAFLELVAAVVERRHPLAIRGTYRVGRSPMFSERVPHELSPILSEAFSAHRRLAAALTWVAATATAPEEFYAVLRAFLQRMAANAWALVERYRRGQLSCGDVEAKLEADFDWDRTPSPELQALLARVAE